MKLILIGFISDSGFCNFNIAIRTLILNYQNIMFNVGGGITWDSDPIKEYEETLQKGKAFLNLLLGDKCDDGDISF
ncbi:chorismate-binding protein [Caldicellulosiruptoraceae bacterium PP1]